MLLLFEAFILINKSPLDILFVATKARPFFSNFLTHILLKMVFLSVENDGGNGRLLLLLLVVVVVVVDEEEDDMMMVKMMMFMWLCVWLLFMLSISR